MNTIDPTKFATREELESELVRLAKASVDELWGKAERNRRLASLHTEFGFGSTEELIAALHGAEPKKRKRTTVTDALRAEVKEMRSQGRNGPFIAKKLGINISTVYRILS